MVGNVAQARERTDAHGRTAPLDRRDRQIADVHDDIGRADTGLPQLQEIGAAGEQARAGARGGIESGVHIGGTDIGERPHQRATSAIAATMLG